MGEEYVVELRNVTKQFGKVTAVNHIELQIHSGEFFSMRPKVAVQITNFAWSGSLVDAANEFIDPEILEEPAIYLPPEVMTKLEGNATPIYERIWTEVKTAE